MMFSATLSDEIRPVCKKFMHNPHEIYVTSGAKLTCMVFNNIMFNCKKPR